MMTSKQEIINRYLELDNRLKKLDELFDTFENLIDNDFDYEKKSNGKSDDKISNHEAALEFKKFLDVVDKLEKVVKCEVSPLNIKKIKTDVSEFLQKRKNNEYMLSYEVYIFLDFCCGMGMEILCDEKESFIDEYEKLDEEIKKYKNNN